MNTTHYLVTLENGYTYYMRSTTWTTELERASTFETVEAAKTALERARQFMKPALYKRAVIVEVKPSDAE